jgi:hypothetical protein
MSTPVELVHSQAVFTVRNVLEYATPSKTSGSLNMRSLATIDQYQPWRRSGPRGARVGGRERGDVAEVG